MGIILNNDQIYASMKIESWWKSSTGDQVFELDGPAGSGKTTLIMSLIEKIGLSLDDVLFVAYMGKAASQMQRNHLPAQTIHSSIYDCVMVYDRDENGHIQFTTNNKPKKKLEFKLKEKIHGKPKLIVVDEGFMVPENIALDLLSFGVPVIVLGDTHQLPPVFGKPFFLNNPDYSLTEIMRQNEGSPIIYISQLLLKHQMPKYGVYGNSSVIHKNELTDYHLKHSDIVITGTNRLRKEINDLFREEFCNISHLEYPNYGEKIICRRNNWGKKIHDKGDIYLTNGLSGYVDYVSPESFTKDKISIDFRPDFTKKVFRDLKVSIPYLDRRLGVDEISYIPPGIERFEYAYAITTHLSQGSQWENVVFLKEDNFFNNQDDYFRLLYTAVTRASESIIWVS